MKEIVFAGSGGQGVLTGGLILSDAAVRKGLNVTWSPSYGSAMRGGTANCTVKFGTDEIYNPQQEEPDVLVVMNQESLEAFLPIVTPKGMVLISDMVTYPADARKDVAVIAVPCTSIANQMGLPKIANIVMTGALIHALEQFSKEESILAMNQMFEKKGKSKFSVNNTKAFEAGYAALS